MTNNEMVWVRDPEWVLLSTNTHVVCRFVSGRPYSRCQGKAVAQFQRKTRRGTHHWWAYCNQHLYGRRVHDGEIEIQVHRDSRMARGDGQ